MAYSVTFEDTNEQIGQFDFETLADARNYNVLSGCGATYSASDLTVTIAAGVVTHNGLRVTVAGDTVTLVPDPLAANPRWAVISVTGAGAVQISHGTAAAVPAKPDPGDATILYAVKVPAALTIANSATTKLDKRFSGAYPLTNYSESVATDTSSGTTHTIDLNDAPVHALTLTDNCTLTFSNPIATGRASSFTLILTQDATGSRLVTWPASVDWAAATAPTLTTTVAAVDVLTFFTVDGGTIWYGQVAGQAYG